MSTPDPFVVAAKPALIAAIDAFLTFNANMGPDPAQWALKYPGAQLVLLGSLGLQAPALLAAEGGAVQGQINTTLLGWKAKLQAP